MASDDFEKFTSAHYLARHQESAEKKNAMGRNRPKFSFEDK